MTVTLSRWNPVSDLAAAEVDRLNGMFEAAFGDHARASVWTPAVDIHETEAKDLVIEADLPATKRADIKVTFENNVLTIAGERKSAFPVPHEQYHRAERVAGPFHRSFTLPSSVDGNRIVAAYADGVLTITVPRREETKARTIEIGA